MKKKTLITFILALSLLTLVGCDALDKVETPTEAVTARPTVRVTIPEGYTVCQIAQLLEEKEVCESDAFISAVNDPSADNRFTASITNAEERPFLLEGYVFPDTYEFYVGDSAQNALAKFLSNMNNKLTDDDYTRAEELGYTMDEILTVASLIQEEAGVKREDAKVAAVLYNRLNSNNFPRLQLNVTSDYLDITVEPCIPGGGEKYNDLYNTYDRKDLPAGPICNPGESAIDAALYPATLAETDNTAYYYFFTYAGLNFYYSTTWAEHNQEYQIRRYWTTATG